MYFKRSYRKRPTYRRRQYRRKNTRTALTRLIRNEIMKTKETKYYELNANSSIATIPIAGVINELTFISQGDTELGRDGLKIYLHSVKVDLNIVVADSYNKVRFLLFYWNDDTAPTTTNIFATGYTSYVQSPFSWPLNPKMRVIYDRKLDVDADDPATYIRHYRKLFNHPCEYTGASQGSGIKGRLFSCIVSDSAAAPHPSCTGAIRLMFKDA